MNNCVGKRNYRFFVSFLASVVLTIGMFFLNIFIFSTLNVGSEVNSTLIIIICSVAMGIIAIPLIGFLIFHIYLAITGKTTREMIKKIEDDKPEKNQWCKVDPPLIDYYRKIDQEEKIHLLN